MNSWSVAQIQFSDQWPYFLRFPLFCRRQVKLRTPDLYMKYTSHNLSADQKLAG